MMDEIRSRRLPFTATQLQELELQALIFNYMALGIPIPSHLVLPFRRSFSLEYPFFLHPSMSCGRRAEEDPEPWRCKRTDGKKWRCSREASGDSKYCERHKHRGKKCISKAAEMPLFTGPAYNSSSSSSYAPPPSSLGDAARFQFEKRKENRNEKEHCFVFGADLKLQKPVNVVTESREEALSPELQLSFFSDRSSESWMNSREECATKLSISISRC